MGRAVGVDYSFNAIHYIALIAFLPRKTRFRPIFALHCIADVYISVLEGGAMSRLGTGGWNPYPAIGDAPTQGGWNTHGGLGGPPIGGTPTRW